MRSTLQDIVSDLENILLGKPEKVKLALTCLLSGGHLLLEDLPGMGKTTLSKALAKALGLNFKRVQFTSDLFPADLIGVSVYRREKDCFEFVKGPLFTHVLLADEINRAPPKTQSALMEAMAEQQVSVDGISHQLPAPFFVIATQNPLFHAGTFPLPESQLDRFSMCLNLGFPHPDIEKKILLGGAEENLEAMPQRISHQQWLDLRETIQKLHASDALISYLQRLLQATRDGGGLGFGLSPRAGMSVLGCARAWAYIHGDEFVKPDHVAAVFVASSAHRLTSSSGIPVEQQLNEILNTTPVV